MRALMLILLTTIGLIGCVSPGSSTAQSYAIDTGVMATEAEPFLRHEQPAPFGSYLAMSIPFAPVKRLHDDLEASTGLTLISRGEAHITVITPIEYDNVLRTHLSMKAIGDLAEAANIQASPVELSCVGRGEKIVNQEALVTYFIVVGSEQLLAVRRAVHQAFVQRGGPPAAFDPSAFYPHITVGFTKRDLHLEDGIKKDRDSCVAALSIP